MPSKNLITPRNPRLAAQRPDEHTNSRPHNVCTTTQERKGYGLATVRSLKDSCTWTAIGTALIENGQCGRVSKASRHLLSADYKEAALSAPTGALRAKVACQEEVDGILL